jgi:hypothetical protein
MGNRKGAYRVLVARPEGKRPIERPGIRWKDNIKIDLQEGWGMDWIYLALERDGWWAVVYAVMNVWFP